MNGARVIKPISGWRLPDFRELREYSDLVWVFAQRDLALRYRQTAVGILWAVIQPMALAAVFAVFLGRLAKVPSMGEIPYPLYVFAGLVMWVYFQQSFARASESTVESSNLISKVYFPRIIIPLVASLSPLVDLAGGLAVLMVALLLWGYTPGLEILLLPAVVLLALTTALGLGLWLSALHVQYRDVRYVVPFMTMIGLFVTPVTYPFDLVPESVQWLYAANPLVGVLELYRFTIFGEMSAAWWVVLIPVVTAVVMLVSGALYFRRAETKFADIL